MPFSVIYNLKLSKDFKLVIKPQKLATFRSKFGDFFPSLTSESSYLVEFKLDSLHNYIGNFNRDMQPHGKGVIMSKNSVFEGNFINGEKHGESRLIKYCTSKPLVKMVYCEYEGDSVIRKTKETYDFDGMPLKLTASLDGTPAKFSSVLSIPGISYIYYWKNK